MPQPTPPLHPVPGSGRLVCDDCAAVYRGVALAAREVAQCRRCGQLLQRGPAPPLDAQAAVTLAALVMFGIANLTPIVVLEVGGARTAATLLEAVRASWQAQSFVALLAFATAFAFPFAAIVLRLHLLLPLAVAERAPAFAPLLRALRWLTRWSMIEVFTLAALIAASRSGTLGHAEIGVGLYAYGALTVLLTAYQGAGAGAIAHPSAQLERQVGSLQRSAAYLVAAAALYVPSNLLPVMVTRTPAGEGAHTLMGGVVELWHTGAWDLALIVFVASLVVPLGKMAVLALLLVSARRGSGWRPRLRARLYRLVEAVGHWSMLDVYVVVLLAGIVSFPPLAAVAPASGLAAFGGVVLLTMLAAGSFDPRLIWTRRDG